jgi:hypothetical protein
MFKNLTDNIQKLELQENNLRTFASQLVNPTFDDEDRNVVYRKIMEIQAQSTDLKTTLKTKQDFYNQNVQGFVKQLKARQATLTVGKTNQRVFEQCPDVLQYFIEKQSHLDKSLQNIKTQLTQ